MKTKLRHSAFLLLFLIPLLAFNACYYYVMEKIYFPWQQLEQQRLASQKLGEIAAVVKFNYHMSVAGEALREKISNALTELPQERFTRLNWGQIAGNILVKPFPDSELLLFYRGNAKENSEIFFANTKQILSRRSLEIAFSSLVDRQLNLPEKELDKRRNEKLLKKLFGSGADPILLAEKQKAVVTPIIYQKIPSFLLWDYCLGKDGSSAGFFLIVKRDQNLEHAALQLAGKVCRLGKDMPGGFIKLFKSGSSDCFFPPRIARFKQFAEWRDSIGIGDTAKVKKWQLKGFPWQQNLGNYSLFTRIIPEEKHLLFILLPAISKFHFKKGLFTLHLFFISLLLLAFFRGFILDQWPGTSIKSRFIIVFSLAATLPLLLFLVSSSAYIFDRLKADESLLEDELANSLLDFDAGKEQMETDYIESFRQSMQSQKILQHLAQTGLASKDQIFSEIHKIFNSDSRNLPLSGVALLDLQGKTAIKDSAEIPMKDLQPLVGFYGHNIVLNLRKKMSYDVPDFVLPRFEVDEKNLAAHQAYGKDGNSMELELERFRGRIFRTKFGRGKIVTLHEFFIVDGKPRFALFICWLDSKVDDKVLARSANLLALKKPKIRVLAFKNTAEGLKFAFKPDRSFSPDLIDHFKRTANISLSSKSGLTRSAAENLSLVGYASPQFYDTALVASIDHHEKNQNHFFRLVIFAITGCFAMIIVVFSGIVTFIRIANPLEKIRNTLDEVRKGNFEFSADMQRQDEIGILNREFKQMINGLQQRQRLASILSDHAIAAISAEEGALKGEETEGVILISDIRNFTTLGETYPPAVLTEMLNRHFAEMAEIIVSNGGRIYKFIGDAIEAVFVNEKTQTFSPQKRALKAAVLMLKRLQSINQIRATEQTFTYQIGVGLAYGDIIAGETGSNETRLEFAMLGKPFKKAEAYEAFTKKVPELKLVFDGYIADSAKEIGFALHEHEFEGQKVYSAADSCLELFKEETESTGTLNSAAISRKTHLQSEKKQISFVGPEKWHNFKTPVFLIGAACLIFAFFALISSSTLHFNKDKEQLRKMHEESLNLGILKAHYADPKSIFEDLLQYESDQIAARLPWKPDGVDADSYSISVEQMLKNLQISGLQPSQFAALHCSGSGTVKIVPPSKLTGCKLVKFLGNQSLFEEVETLMQRLVMRSVALYYPKEKDFAEQMHIIPLILGIKQPVNILYNDFHARAHSVIRQGKDEFFYWQTILQRNPDFHVDLISRDVSKYLREKPSSEALACIGGVLFHFPDTMVKTNFFNILGKSLQNQGLEYLMLFADGKKVSSRGFPVNSELLHYNSPALKSEKGWLFKEKFNRHEDSQFRVILARPIEELSRNTFVDFYLPAGAFLILLWIWYKTVFYQKAMAGKFATQLWTGLLAAAIFPISSVYLVNELNAVDREKISIDQERTKLINQFEKLERRQVLQETLIWESLDQISSNSDLAKLIDICDENPVQKNLAKVEQKIMELAKATKYNEAIVYSNKGWHQSVYPQKQLRETGEFKRFVQAFISDYFVDLGSAMFVQGQQKLGNAVKDEMTREAGLEIFRNLFGSDAYFSLVHGLDMPIRIFANTGIACLKMLPVPQIVKPERMFFWLFLDNMNQTLRYIFKNADSDFAIFTDSKVMYGAQKHAHEAGNAPDIVFACRWLNATKAPVSISSQVAGYKFLIEGRVGRINEVMLLIGMIPEEIILAEVEIARKRLLFGLILSVFAIVMLSLALSSDFIRPIQDLTIGAHNVSRQNFGFRLKTERKDELGQLILTFNQMIKGLQEKELMGKMVSRSAQKIAADEERLREAEVGMKLNLGILYIAVPAFATFIETMPSKQLIGELKEHITTLCRIIMENGGDVDKLMGEKILAIFYSEEGKTAAIKQMIKTIEEIRNAERNGRLPFPVTLGAHFGEVLAGLLGVGNQRDFTVIGDPVNTAARICAKASELPRERFLVSSLVANTCQLPEVEFRNYGEVELKGKAETIELFQLFFKR